MPRTSDKKIIRSDDKEAVMRSRASKPSEPASDSTRPRAANFSSDEKGNMQCSSVDVLMKSFATNEPNLAAVLLSQVSDALPLGKEDQNLEKSLNFASQAMHSLEPRNGLDALLCSQLICTHSLGMEFLRRAAAPNQSSDGVDLNVNRATRLLRVFASLSETLRAYRTGGEQKVFVEHVHVHQGGQAIVGAVNHSNGREGGGDGGNYDQ
jgi:hypothetical protein